MPLLQGWFTANISVFLSPYWFIRNPFTMKSYFPWTTTTTKKKSQIEDEEYYCNRKMVRTKKAYNFVNRGWEEAFGIEFLGSESEGFSFLILKTLLAMSATQKGININKFPLQWGSEALIALLTEWRIQWRMCPRTLMVWEKCLKGFDTPDALPERI